jgi:hypothetical protein
MRALVAVSRYPTQSRMTIEWETTEQTLCSFCPRRHPFDKCAGEAVDDWDGGKVKATPFFTSFFLDLLMSVSDK